jgi:glycoside/pentoside/hexuronide:cation symporter, GPH family
MQALERKTMPLDGPHMPTLDKSSAPLRKFDVASYAAPVAGSYFFYISMWSVVPGVYGKYFGLPLTAIATVILVIRLFDGLIDTATGYLSDWHRCSGGSRKPWVVVGGVGSVIASYFLYTPPSPATQGYYLLWSMAYFLAFTITEIPHLTWGSELSMDYQQRANVFGIRNMVGRFGITIFYALPLLPFAASGGYTPQFLHSAIYVGAVMTLVGLIQALVAAPAGSPMKVVHHDSLQLLTRSLLGNIPLLIYFVAFVCIGLCVGMWSALNYFYVDSYLGLGQKMVLMFLAGSAVAGLATPFWLKIIQKTSKSAVWAIGIAIFVAQLGVMGFLAPGCSWWIPLVCVVLAHVCFCCHDVAALALLGDIVDYGKLKFGRDRGATYFGFNTLLYKVGLGFGAGIGLGIAGLFGFDPTHSTHSAVSVLGLKIAFTGLPTLFAMIGLCMIIRTPIDRRRHETISRRLKALEARARQSTYKLPPAAAVEGHAHVGT